MSQVVKFGNAPIPPGTYVEFLEGNSGGAVGPDGSGIINTIGSGNVTVVGNPGLNTLTAQLTGITQHSLQVGSGTNTLTQLGVAGDGFLPIGSAGADPVLAQLQAGTGISIANAPGSITISAAGTDAQSFPTDSGTATPALGVLNIDGDSHNITTTGSGNTVTVGLTGITQHSLQVGGAANALTQLGVALDGQIPIGSTGANPVLATLTAGTNVSITNAAGSITINATPDLDLTYTPVSTSPYVVLSTDQFLGVDCSTIPITIQLPNAPGTGRVVVIKDSTGSCATNNITVTTVGGTVNIDGATTFVLNTAYMSIQVLFDGTTYQVF